jgi:TIR domain
MHQPPYAFLCHASEDKKLVERLAHDLRAAGVETFFDKWEIRSGDSLRRKIDEGLGQCTHFLALLSPVSLTKPWVNAELDAGFVRKVNSQATLIPVRIGLDASALPPLLAGILSPSLDDYGEGLKTLIEDIHGVSKKPPLGSRGNMFSSAWGEKVGLSVAAARVAEIFLLRSQRGRAGDPSLEVKELLQLTGYSNSQLIEAIDELEECSLAEPARVMGAPPFGYEWVRATDHLFSALDAAVMGWSTENDARAVATLLINDERGRGSAHELVERLGWNSRRLNPALAYLRDNDLVTISRNLDSEYVTTSLLATPRTRRFARNG